MSGYADAAGNISAAISNMLNANEGLIANAIDKRTAMKAWMIVGVAIVAVVILVKKMGK
jgi:hypothetical protein